MWHHSCFSIFFCFLFFLIPHRNGSSVDALSADIINATCKHCTNMSIILDYNFCFTSLQAIPASHVTNLQGLAIIAMELALANTTTTVTTIEKLLSKGGFNPFAKECLRDCLELYADAVSMLVNSIGAFLGEQYDAANLLMSAVMEVTATCEEGFTEKEGGVTPLLNENYNLFELSGVALCIINLLALGLPAVPS